MASTATLKLPGELKARIVAAAKASGKSPHAFIIEALNNNLRLAEMRRSFINDAVASAAEVDANGKVYTMEDVQAYLLALAAGKAAKRPKPVTLSNDCSH